MNKSEIQLFLLWNNARSKESEIISELSKSFEIIEIYEIEWDKTLFKKHLERFYCEKIRSKVKHTGTGSFLLVMVRDNSPEYKYMQTLKGYEIVNSKILTLKKKFRALTGGGYKVHSTNDKKEVDANLIFLLNKSYEEYEEYSKNKKWVIGSEYIKIKGEPVGTYGWKNIDEVFHFLNSSCSYVVLRGLDLEGGDIDLLVDDFSKVRFLLNATKVHKNKFRTQVSCLVDGKECLFDLMYVGDNYYCQNWEEDILKRRVFSNSGNYFVPSLMDRFYSIFYHVYFHKKQPSKKYDEQLFAMYKKLFGTDCVCNENMHNVYLKVLQEFLDKNDYFPVKPKDRKVKYNPNAVKKMYWIKVLEKYGFSNLTVFEVTKKPLSGFDCFFSAEYDGERVFIKCGEDANSVKKEYDVTSYLYAQNQEYFSKPIMYKVFFDNKMFIATSYIKGDMLSVVDLSLQDENKLNKMFDSLIEIANILFINKFVNRDFNPNNLMVSEDGLVKLLDMQHVIGSRFPELSDNLINPKKIRGTNKRLRPYPFVFDDMFSVYHILKKFPNNKIKGYDEKIKDIKSKIGKLRNYFFDNKFPISSYFKYNLLLFYKILNSIIKPFRKIIRKIR